MALWCVLLVKKCYGMMLMSCHEYSDVVQIWYGYGLDMIYHGY